MVRTDRVVLTVSNLSIPFSRWHSIDVNTCCSIPKTNNIQQVLVVLTSEIIHPGSGENHMAYFYKRTNPLSIPSRTAPKVFIPKRVGFDEEDEEVVCDPSFLSAIKLAVGPVEGEFINRVLVNFPHHVIVALCLRILCVSVLDKCDNYWSVVVFYGECIISLIL